MKKIVLTFTGTYSDISNSQEELIALVTSCSYWLFQRQHGYAAVYCLCLLLHSTSRLGAAAASYRDLPPAWPEAV